MQRKQPKQKTENTCTNTYATGSSSKKVVFSVSSIIKVLLRANKSFSSTCTTYNNYHTHTMHMADMRFQTVTWQLCNYVTPCPTLAHGIDYLDKSVWSQKAILSVYVYIPQCIHCNIHLRDQEPTIEETTWSMCMMWTLSTNVGYCNDVTPILAEMLAEFE